MPEYSNDFYQRLAEKGLEVLPDQPEGSNPVRGLKGMLAQTADLAKIAYGAATGNEGMVIGGTLDSQLDAAKYRGDTQNFSDIDSLGDFGDWLGYQAGQTVGNLATTVAGGGAGGMIAKTAVKSAAKSAAKNAAVRKGVVAGALATTYPQQFGENVAAIVEENDGKLPDGAVAKAATVATLQSTLDLMPFMDVVRKLGVGDQVGKEVIQRTLSSPTRIRQIGRTVGTTALQEGATEATQEALKLAALEWVNEHKDRLTTDNFIALLDSFMAGVGGSGGIMGGIGGMSQALHSDKPWFKAIEDEKQVIADEYGRTGDREKPGATHSR